MEEQGLIVVKDNFLIRITRTLKRFFFKGKLKNKRVPLGAPALSQVRQLYSPAASDMHFVRDIAFGSDMRYARLKQQRRIEYHCDHREQYHFCEAKISR